MGYLLPPCIPHPLVQWLTVGGRSDIPPPTLHPAVGVVGVGTWVDILGWVGTCVGCGTTCGPPVSLHVHVPSQLGAERVRLPPGAQWHVFGVSGGPPPVAQFFPEVPPYGV